MRQSSVRGCRFSFVFVYFIIKCVKCSPVSASFFPYISTALRWCRNPGWRRDTLSESPRCWVGSRCWGDRAAGSGGDRQWLPEAVVLEQKKNRWDGRLAAVLLGRGGVAAIREGAEEQGTGDSLPAALDRRGHRRPPGGGGASGRPPKRSSTIAWHREWAAQLVEDRAAVCPGTGPRFFFFFTFNTLNNKINKHNRKAAAPHGRLPHTKHKLKLQAWSSLVFHCCHSSFNPSEAPPWDSRPVSGAGVVHYQLLHRPRSVPTALGPAPLVTVSY